MLYFILLLVAAALAGVVAALITASSLWAWISTGLSVVALLLLAVDWFRRRSREAPADTWAAGSDPAVDTRDDSPADEDEDATAVAAPTAADAPTATDVPTAPDDARAADEAESDENTEPVENAEPGEQPDEEEVTEVAADATDGDPAAPDTTDPDTADPDRAGPDTADPDTADSDTAEPARAESEQSATTELPWATEDDGASETATDPDATSNVPGEESTAAEDARLLTGLKTEVLVVDEYPRYHSASCDWLSGRETIPIAVSEARELGFTPCVLCAPDAGLLAGRRSRSKKFRARAGR